MSSSIWGRAEKVQKWLGLPALARVVRYATAMRGMMSSLAILVVAIVVIWAIGRMVGFEISLWGTLIGSIVLTVILNLVLGLFRRR